MKIKISILAIAALMFTACEKEYEAEQIQGNNLSGQWFVQTSVGGSVVLGYQQILTYNTAAADGNQIWVDDEGHIWPFKVKSPASPDANSFGGPALSNASLGDTTTVTISNGQIIPDGGKSATGITVDSIYMECQFSDDPGTTYVLAGHYRTGFLEDEL